MAKILAKVLAVRFSKFLIHEDQVGYFKGRHIETIIRIIDDSMEFIDINNITGAIVALDYS